MEFQDDIDEKAGQLFDELLALSDDLCNATNSKTLATEFTANALLYQAQVISPSQLTNTIEPLSEYMFFMSLKHLKKTAMVDSYKNLFVASFGEGYATTVQFSPAIDTYKQRKSENIKSLSEKLLATPNVAEAIDRGKFEFSVEEMLEATMGSRAFKMGSAFAGHRRKPDNFSAT